MIVLQTSTSKITHIVGKLIKAKVICIMHVQLQLALVIRFACTRCLF